MKEKQTGPSAGPIPAERAGECISPENLSAEIDGEYAFTPEERAHLEQCPRCRDLYASYRVIDDAVSRVMTVNCSGAAAARIRKSVNRELDQLAPMRSHEHIRFYALAARVAAGVVIAAMAFYLIFIDSPYADTEELAEPAGPTRTVAAARPEKTPAKPVSSGLPAGVDVRHLQLSSAGAPAEFRFTDPSGENRAGQVGLIPDAVKHVWQTGPGWEIGQTERVFRSSLQKAGIPLDSVRVKVSPDGTLRADMTITRYAAADLTRRLAAEGMQLVSPVQPQPEQRLFAGTGREPVEYEAVFLRKL